MLVVVLHGQKVKQKPVAMREEFCVQAAQQGSVCMGIVLQGGLLTYGICKGATHKCRIEQAEDMNGDIERH